ncbi:hypothetical protein ACQ9KO_24865, partial [Escherichia coli]
VQQFYFPNVLKYDPDQLRGELSGPAGSSLIGYQANINASFRTIESRLRDFVSLHDYWLPTDGDDYAPALNRALVVSPNVMIPPRKHTFRTTVSLLSDVNIIGFG